MGLRGLLYSYRGVVVRTCSSSLPPTRVGLPIFRWLRRFALAASCLRALHTDAQIGAARRVFGTTWRWRRFDRLDFGNGSDFSSFNRSRDPVTQRPIPTSWVFDKVSSSKCLQCAETSVYRCRYRRSFSLRKSCRMRTRLTISQGFCTRSLCSASRLPCW